MKPRVFFARAPLAARVALAALLVLPLLGCPPDRKPACEPTSGGRAPQRLCNPHSVILLRHAEKVTTDPDDKDPELAPAGQERAARLAKLLAKTAITRLIATEYKRTRNTLVPLSQRIGREVETRNAGQTNDLVSELGKAPPGTTIVVATHSNVLPRIVADLGGGPLVGLDERGNLPDTEYGRVLVLSVGCSTTATVVELSSD